MLANLFSGSMVEKIEIFGVPVALVFKIFPVEGFMYHCPEDLSRRSS